MVAMLDDFFVDKLGDLSHGVVCRAVEFVGFGGGGVVFDHLVERFANVDSLDVLLTLTLTLTLTVSRDVLGSYMDGPKAFLHMVCGQCVRYAC